MDIRHEADATGVMLEARVVESRGDGGAIVLLASASLTSLSQLGDLSRYSQAALPEAWICTSQNMDQAMALTAVGRCNNFQQEAGKKSIFDDWHGPH